MHSGRFKARVPGEAPAGRRRRAPRWGGRALALAAGALPVVAFPEPGWWWAAFVALVPLLLVVRSAPDGREGAIRGWLGAAGFLFATHHWLTLRTGVFMPLLVLALALPWALWGRATRAALAPPLDGRRLARALAVVPAGWLLIEVARSWEHLGGPWGLLGASQWNRGAALPLAAVGGIWLVSAVVVAVNVALASALAPGTPARVRAGAGLVAAGLLAAGPLVAALRPEPPAAGSLTVAVVQPGPTTGPVPRFDAAERLTRTLAGTPVDLVVWGESSVGFDLDERPDLTRRLQDLAAGAGADVLVNVDARRGGGGGIYKSSVLVGPDGAGARYDKARLVPFGEYIPLRPVLGWTAAVTDATTEDRRRGRGVTVLHAAGRRIGPLVCFESAFPDLSRALVRRGAELLVYQSATTTFQDTWAPEQHAALAALRAVETGRPTVHATLTGVTAAFDPAGHRLAWHGTDRRGTVVLDVPLVGGRTPYVRFGQWAPALAGLVVAGAAARAWWRQPARKLSRTRRRGLSALRSTSTSRCQVPRRGRPPSTGTVSEGLTSAGKRWSAP